MRLFISLLLIIDWTIVGTVASIIGILPLLPKLLSKARAQRERYTIVKHIGAELHAGLLSPEDLRYFVQPKCLYVAPSGGTSRIAACPQQLFDVLDYMLERPKDYKYIMLLAESGMGKTTALLWYYLRHKRRRKPKFEMLPIPLSDSDMEAKITAVEGKANTVLLLDGLDENELALVDHLECLRFIIRLTSKFYCALITCRTQFFPKDEEIPEETGVPKVGPRGAGQKPEYSLHKIYLLPFDEQQINKYLRRRYWFWRKRKKVLKLIKPIRQLAARPMLLKYTDDLLREKKTFEYSYELYEVMVKGWLDRETIESSSLRQFSELLAVHLYERNSEKISEDALKALAKEWEVKIEEWKLSGRSLLNRDPLGGLKFADSFIMEHLFVCRFLSGDARTLQMTWTDQMHLFFWERVMQQWKGTDYPRFADEPFKLLLEHPDGIDKLIKSHVIYTQTSNDQLPLEKWDRFGVSVIANLLHVSNHTKPFVTFMRIDEESYPYNFGEQKIKFTFSGGALCQCSEGRLYYLSSGPDKNFAVRDYRGEVSAVQLAEDEVSKELPKEVANCLFDVPGVWIRRAFRMRPRSGQDIILAFQTITPVDGALVDKIIHCAGALF